ncbi:hypothetical protein DER46DRAFT_397906 [Fusarium sp. MPI-SDFR-AT-0072]|nr:hypothetical protein DER46DRAFT_397906 [Fusarium sp. MPI-SDFR-AT-0072]
MVSCNLGAVGLLLSAEDLPLSSFLHLSSQSDAILNLLVFFLSTEDLPLKPIFARSCKLSWDRRPSSVHRRSPTEAHLCTVLQAFLGPQAFFCPQKISCLCPSLQVLQSFFGIVSQAFLGLQVFFCPQKISCLCPSLQVLRSCDCRSSIHRRSPAYILLCRS